MNKTKTAMATVALGITALMLARPEAEAADHIDAPGSLADSAADLTDFYAWHQDDRIVAAVAFSGLDVPGSTGTFDNGVLYGIHLDNDGDNIADQDVWARFGQDPDGNWGLKVEGLPGGEAEVVGPVGEVLDAGLGLRVFAGVRDDPFFFDLDGFIATLDTATLAFDGDRDSFASTNVTMIIVEMSIDGAAAGSDNVQLWATTARR